MDKKKLVIGGVVGIGAIALVLHVRAANAAAASAAQQSGASNSTSDLVSADLPVSTSGYAGTGLDLGSYSSGATSSTSSTASPSLDSSAASNVASFASLLQGVLSSGASYAQASQANTASNNAAAVASIQQTASTGPTVSSTPAAPVAAPAAAPLTDTALVENTGGFLTANLGLMATNPQYTQAWNAVSAANQSAFGTGWNSVGKGANSDQLTQEVTMYFYNHFDPAGTPNPVTGQVAA